MLLLLPLDYASVALSKRSNEIARQFQEYFKQQKITQAAEHYELEQLPRATVQLASQKGVVCWCPA